MNVLFFLTLYEGESQSPVCEYLYVYFIPIQSWLHGLNDIIKCCLLLINGMEKEI